MIKEEKKEMTLDDLAIMVANGFNSVNDQFKGVNKRFDKLEKDVAELKTDVSILKTDVSELKTEVSGLRSSINNYLELSDKRYLELKARQNVIAGWVKTIANKTGIKIDLAELEKTV